MVRADEVETQQRMEGESYGPLDDYPYHQIARTAARSGDGGAGWFEHDVLYFLPPGSDGPMVLTWFQMQPNKDRVQAWVMVNFEGAQYNLVMARPLSHNRQAMRVGPLRYEVLEPLRRYQVRLDADVGYPFAYDLEYEARNPPKLFDRRVYKEESSGEEVRHCHSDQSLYISRGNFEIDGRRFDLSAYLGGRDHCWGIRSGPHPERAFHVPLLAHFDDFSLSMWYEELTDGTPLYAVGHIAYDATGESLDIVEFEHEVVIDPRTRDFVEQRWTLTDVTGRSHALEIRPLRAGGFQRYSEVIGERLHHSGDDAIERPGLLSLDLQKIDLQDDSVLAGPLSREQRQQYSEFKLDGHVGYGVCTWYVSENHAKYGKDVRQNTPTSTPTE